MMFGQLFLGQPKESGSTGGHCSSKGMWYNPGESRLIRLISGSLLELIDMRITVLLLAVFVATASLIPFVRGEAWWIRILDFPRTQILALGLLVLGLCFFYWGFRTWQGKILFSVVASTILIQCAYIFPYTPVARNEVLPATGHTPEATISLLIANVLMPNRRTEGLLDMIAEQQPDVVLLLELRWPGLVRQPEG